MSTYSIRHMNRLGGALERAGFTPDEVAKLRNSGLLPEVLKVLRGHAKIVVFEHLIDCDADPFVPDRRSVVEHRKGGVFKWDAAAVTLYLNKRQKNGKIKGNELRKKLANKPVLNANVLDYLLANPHLTPEEWKGKVVFFWGTIYCNRDGNLYVRCLYWNGVRWHWNDHWLDHDWNDNNPAANREAPRSH